MKLRILIAFLSTVFISLSSWAGGGGTTYTYYAKATASVNPSGAGKVYVGSTTPRDEDYKETSSSVMSIESESKQGDSLDFKLFAKAEAGYKFSKWTSTSPCTFDNPTKESCTVTMTATSTTEDSPTVVPVVAEFEPLPRIGFPKAEPDLTYDGKVKTGVKAGTGYTLSGNTATAAGTYTATATLDADYLWEDGSSEPAKIAWTIQRRVVTVTAQDASKTFGEKDPERFAATVAGTLGSDSVSYAVARVQGEENVGTWAIEPSGAAQQGNYDVRFASGSMTIVPRPILVSVIATNKVYGAEDPEFSWEIRGTEEFPLDADGKMPNGETPRLEGKLLRTSGEDTKDSAYDIDTLTSFNETNNPNYVFEAQLDGEERFAILPRGGVTVRVIGNCATNFHNGGEQAVRGFTLVASDPLYKTENVVFMGTAEAKGTAAGTYPMGLSAAQFENADGNFKDVAFLVTDGELVVEPKPVVTITIEPGAGIMDVMDEYGESLAGELELPAGMTQVELTLEASGLTVPVFKVVRGNVTNVTSKTATYSIEDGDTLEFFAEEADETDQTVDDDQIKTAIKEAIDPADPDDEGDVERYNKAVAKVEAVVGEGANQVSAREFAAYINENPAIHSEDIAASDYVAASVKLNAADLINDETEVEIAELVKAEGNALTFEVNIEDEPVNVEAIKDMVEASSDLSDWAKHKLEVTTTFAPGEEGEAGKVTITPVGSPDKAFMRVVIPKDPGAK